MNKMLKLLKKSAFAILIAVAPNLHAAIPVAPPTAGPYRVIFVTASTTIANFNDITTYQTFIDNQSKNALSFYSDTNATAIFGETIDFVPFFSHLDRNTLVESNIRDYTETTGTGGVEIWHWNGTSWIKLAND
jgi:hypothetical protein